MKEPITNQIITFELIEKIAAMMGANISGMNLEEIQKGMIAELDHMETRHVEALSHEKLVRAFDLAFNNIVQNPVFYSDPQSGDIGHPLTGTQGTHFDTTATGETIAFESLIREELNTILKERKKQVDFKKFKKLSKENNQQELLSWLHINANIFVNEGSSRSVYILDSSKVIKMALNDRGLGQNEAEVDLYTNPKLKPIITKIYDYDPDYRWIVSEIVQPLNNSIDGEEEFEEYYDTNLGTLARYQGKYEKSGLNLDIFLKQPQVQKAFPEPKGFKFFEYICRLMDTSKLLAGDVFAIDHWGKTADGRIVLLDYGFTVDVREKHYR